MHIHVKMMATKEFSVLDGAAYTIMNYGCAYFKKIFRFLKFSFLIGKAKNIASVFNKIYRKIV